MDDLLLPSTPVQTSATDAKGLLPGATGLRLDEENIPIHVVHGPQKTLDELVPFGQKRTGDHGTLLRLWPGTLWVLGDIPETLTARPLPMADIGHGQTRLRLRGINALHFIAQYASADLQALSIRQTSTIRTSINHYDVVLWWDSTRDLHLVVDRSYAQSFCDHIRALAARNGAVEPGSQNKADNQAGIKKG